ncbi:hypothetical protein EAL2_c21060 [Peptoclostridium acidaminophilum DSM 3953]|uniref:Uncharacterized protein n=1 Tax=Peptoclostridium acidaminophilum DSM 3953 TaxID=1286171 RepID=W8TMF6_PEPAC|nr:DUF1292 domain-containing protein [Peptoclostridium acidaminophilum]AHM57387.1 hypothetical protein EAL2_c21060 [Peptoclostridium acidaminophilum DSM 3953]
MEKKLEGCGCGCGCDSSETEVKESCCCNEFDECGAEESEGCGCGCGGEDDEEYETLDITLDDGKVLSCIVLGVFDVEEIEGKEYIALLPEEHEDVFLYEFAEDEEGVELSNIEDDAEFEKVSQKFSELFQD